jgi:3D (Asp-Asp-Asp) domain-containing protein
MATLMTMTHGGHTRRCNATCYNAKKHKCQCICGGKNHAQGFEQARQNTTKMILDDPSIQSEIISKQEVLPV